MAVEQVFGAETVWHCEIDEAASKVLAHRWPGVPNHRDLTTTDWDAVEPVDIMCAGWPCQPFSLAGKRKGADDERAIWPHIADAVRLVRPRIVVLENVTAVLTREFGRVADSLAALGYDLRWTSLRASDVGAPHQRERLFVVAHATGERWAGCDESWSDVVEDGSQPAHIRAPGTASDASCDGRHEGRAESAGVVGGSNASVGRDGSVDLLPTPAAARSGRNQSPSPGAAVRPSLNGITDLLPTLRTSDTNGAGVHGQGGMDLRTAVLLPTPNAADGNGGGRYSSDGHQTTLPGEARLLCTPSASDGAGGKASRSGSRIDEPLLGGQAREMEGGWGKYTRAIKRWEAVTRPAPAPTEPNSKGNPRLSARFSEWLMGWPPGWVTDVPGLKRNEQLRIIGNGVVPQQAAAALTWLLSIEAAA